MRYIQLLLFVFISNLTLAQEKGNLTSYSLINIGYSNLNGNYLKIGPEVYLVQNNHNIIDLSLTANMAYFKNHFVVIPEFGIGYQFVGKNSAPYNEYIKATFYTVRVNGSPWNITPEIGLTLLGILEANIGYSFEFKKHKYTSLEGLKLGLTLHLPTSLFLK